jgi:hypothetical protein
LTGNFADMTGDWTIHAISQVPTGYTTAGYSGNGPTDGQPIHFGYYTAVDGSSQTHHGLSIWGSASDLTSCGGEGVSLPSGWNPSPNSAPNNLLTTATNVSTTFPVPSAVHISCYNGQNFAGLPAAACAGATSGNQWQATATCDAILSTYSSSGTWSQCDTSSCSSVNSHWGMTPNEAAFMCVLNNIHQASGSCTGNVNIDWGGLWGNGNTTTNPFSGIGFASGAWTGILAGTDNHDSVTYFNGAVRFDKNPSQRFMMGEIFVNGNVGSLTDHHDHTANACTGNYNSNGSCASSTVTCHLSENNKITITQVDSTHANVELVQVTTVAPTDDSHCATDVNASKDLGQNKWMFAVSK